MSKKNVLETTIAGLKLKSPVMIASGIAGFGGEYNTLHTWDKLGAFVTKTITYEPRSGNPTPRVYETPAGMLNSIGLENPGVELFVKEYIPVLKKLGTKIVVSIAGTCAGDYVKTIRRIDDGDTSEIVAAYELNLSCPNVAKRTVGKTAKSHCIISQDEKLTASVIAAVKKVTCKPIFAKLSPNVTDIKLIASAAERAGADAVVVINTLLGMAVDIQSRKPRIANVMAGLSGAAVFPIALRCVYECVQTVKIPIIGVGGIASAEDAIAMLISGASAVQVGSGLYKNPNLITEVVDGIEKYLKKQNVILTNLISSLRA
ncbi:MAG: dihydroorotate dehydrogenase [Elusimicrobiota bacterium]